MPKAEEPRGLQIQCDCCPGLKQTLFEIREGVLYFRKRVHSKSHSVAISLDQLWRLTHHEGS